MSCVHFHSLLSSDSGTLVQGDEYSREHSHSSRELHDRESGIVDPTDSTQLCVFTTSHESLGDLSRVRSYLLPLAMPTRYLLRYRHVVSLVIHVDTTDCILSDCF